eukprot:scaffold31252_cov63-Phaeocystis_antarctica.AAC.16
MLVRVCRRRASRENTTRGRLSSLVISRSAGGGWWRGGVKHGSSGAIMCTNDEAEHAHSSRPHMATWRFRGTSMWRGSVAPLVSESTEDYGVTAMHECLGSRTYKCLNTARCKDT